MANIPGITIDWPGTPFIQKIGSVPPQTVLKPLDGDPPVIKVDGVAIPISNVYTQPRAVEDFGVGSQQAPDYLTGQLTNQVSRHSYSGMMDDLSLNLSRFFQDGETSVSQSATHYRYQTVREEAVPIDHANFVADYSHSEAEVRMRLKTKDGDTVTFTIQREAGMGHDDQHAGVNFRTLSVNYELDGQLSDKERKELDSLAQGLNQLANHYFSGNQPQLSDLNLSDITVISELKLSFEDQFLPDLSLEMTDTDLRRDIKASVNGDKVEMFVDKLGLVGTSDSDRRLAALTHYRDMLLQGVNRAKGDSEQRAFLVDAFDLLHGPLERVESRHDLSEPESAVLTGLADFSIQFESRVVRQNPLRQNQAETFSLTLAQETRFQQDGVLNRETEQRQIWELDASYFKPLTNWEFVDFQNQNYRYYELSERAEVRTLTGLDEGEVYGAQSQSFESRFDAQEYRMGQLVDWKTTEKSYASITDFTERLRNLEVKQNLVALDELLLDPVAMSKQARITSVDQDVSAIPKVAVPQDRP